jgi:hypothetical protein
VLPVAEASDEILRRTLLRRTTNRPTTANAITAEARKRGSFELMLTAPLTAPGCCDTELPSIVVDDVAVGDGAGNAVGIFLSAGATIMDMEKLRLMAACLDRERS